MPEGARTAAGIRVDKLLAKIGLAESVSDAVRKIRAGAVEINGQRVHDLVLADAPAELIVQVGKNWRRVVT
jgi:tyrosyl-tRNA synthetase